MSGAPKPPVIPEPFAKNADPLYITTIPTTTGVAGRASYSLGFPPLTMQPVAGGGKPPFGQDMNGALFAVTSHDFYVQAGQLFQWDASVAAAVGGYAVGALLGSTDLKTVWFNTIDANSTNPDATDGSAAGWVSLFATGFQAFTGLTGGVGQPTVTLNPTQAARKVITLAGTLTGNLAIVLPNWTAPAGRWLFINNTTGSFSVTARTVAGTGVNVPQGGPANPLEVYGDGTNIYPAVTPLGVPISQGADPLTLAERDNTGNIFGNYFHTAAAAEAAGGFSNVYCEGAGPDQDGLIRKFTLAYFQAQLTLSLLSGQVTAGQVPLAAVTQYATSILANAALTGAPTAPTAAVGTSTPQVASCAFVNPSSNLVAQGSRENPDGSIDKWGTLHVGDVVSPAGGTISFPVAFPTACYNVEITGFDANATGATFVTCGGASNQNNFTWFIREIASATQDVTLQWRAIGK